jgi:hypothetical protein
MTYNELIQLYFERSNALQAYWTLYVVIVGGLLAFSSIRRLPAPLTTLIVSLLFAVFTYENLDAIVTVTVQRHATLALIKQADPAAAAGIAPLRQQLEPTLTPASESSSRRTHLIGDVLAILAIWAMELGRRRRTGPRGAVLAAAPA